MSVRKPGATKESDDPRGPIIGSYLCPYCRNPMRSTQILDLGPVDKYGTLKRYHRECKVV